MKIYKIYLILTVLFLASCEDYLDINDDPYLPQTASPHLYLPQIVYSMAEGEMFDSRYVGAYTQNWVSLDPNEYFDRHGFSARSGTQKFRNHYWSTGSNLNEMVEQARERQLGGYQGIAKAVRAWSWQVVTDHHGELPYRQAWDNTRTKFEYDSQELIYGEIQTLADEAIALLNEPEFAVDSRLAGNDFMYEGDLIKWEKFAYAIKARNAHHLSNKASYNPDEVISFVDQSFTSNDDNASVIFAGDGSANSSFMGPTRANFEERLASELIISYLDGTYAGGTEDPRLPLMFNTNEDSVYVGIAPTAGDTAGIAPLLYGKYLFQDDVPYPLMTYAEMQFIKSEAAFIKGDRATAHSAFLTAVQAHVDMVGVAPDEANAYIVGVLPATAEALTLSDIMWQKYIALYTNNETWSDLRRYDWSSEVFPGFTLPDNLVPDNNGLPSERWLPRQFSEYDWNQEALEAIGGFDNDYQTRPMWFSEAN
ncbi:SusD/RagB family nutrient-binding outer membrane lipoprotein [Tunicatimonas pelagia]|uniref:SusD/RagB family nutrient-binding outer membrane lipoprotein n=1 Tax=Tunicatimonas pelagia TaxID=931531 RepID=UPI002667145F|nr:SusD/RagB family nutrient-binding outer membrane lipoprotein [Tunicatimonas pelagia]WKN43370.1 SusD/RagB family nutrient-binding outer membrane lipoprotein [Tunicatimonas pelagia]